MPDKNDTTTTATKQTADRRDTDSRADRLADVEYTEDGEPINPSTDWHSFQLPYKPLNEEEQEELNRGERQLEVDEDRDECETCGEPRDALVHQGPEGQRLHEARLAVAAAEEKLEEA